LAVHIDHLQTEGRNPDSMNLDELSPLEIVRLMNAEDAKVFPAIAAQEHTIAQAIEVIADRLRNGGRLIYAGAGTSGRLGVLDATECPPTFNTDPSQVVGIIAGGHAALTSAVEGAEDHPEFAETDLKNLNFTQKDVLVGIATSGRTPYVLGAVAYAKQAAAFTIGISCNPDAELSSVVDLAIMLLVGPEVLTGSTRLKAGTATKLVLNMLTTGAMVRLGKTYGNLMVDLRATNSKLRARSNRLVRIFTDKSVAEADELLRRCDGELKTAIVVGVTNATPADARARLIEADGQVRAALGALQNPLARQPRYPGLILGIDGGGSHTLALLARLEGSSWKIIGRGGAGPSNLHACGSASSVRALDAAVAGAFVNAGLPRGIVQAVSFGMAGVDRLEDQATIRDWATRADIATNIDVVNDAAILLAAGTPQGWGLAIIAGTGSIAYGRTADGRTARAGGWGYLLGDEGSGYAIAMKGLQAACRAADGAAASTQLLNALLSQMNLREPSELIGAIYGGNWPRKQVAALAPRVLEVAANGDATAMAIVEHAATGLAVTACTVARRLYTEKQTIPLALTGGLVVQSELFRNQLLRSLEMQSVTATPVTLVTEPAEGALKRAAALVNSPTPAAPSPVH
jgi:N-acetylmuramic acid 6-phosphate etherase